MEQSMPVGGREDDGSADGEEGAESAKHHLRRYGSERSRTRPPTGDSGRVAWLPWEDG
jgi:hypothetical protein